MQPKEHVKTVMTLNEEAGCFNLQPKNDTSVAMPLFACRCWSYHDIFGRRAVLEPESRKTGLAVRGAPFRRLAIDRACFHVLVIENI